MESTNHRVATPSAVGLALLASALLLLSGGWFGAHGSSQSAAELHKPNLGFLHPAAGVDGRLQMLRQLEKRMLAHAEVPQKTAEYRDRRDAVRREIDELMLLAGAAAGSDEERARVQQLAATVRLADFRLARINQLIVQLNGESE